MRLAKYLAHAGVASRRAAERMIDEGRVAVGGEPVFDPALDVTDRDSISVDGQLVAIERREHHALHKPVGVVSTASDPQGRPKVTDLIDSEARLYPVGRLDADSSGLIILTNDGELANRLMHPRYEVPKTYRALVEGRIGESQLEALRTGVELEDGVTAPAQVRATGQRGAKALLELTIHEGRKRQVRRMCEAVGHPVIELQRIQIGGLRLGDLAPGASRRLDEAEVGALRALAGDGA